MSLENCAISLLFSITQDFLLFAPKTPTFCTWAVLGEGCSSARGPLRITGASNLRGRVFDNYLNT